MKLKTFFAAAAFIVALASCGPKEQPISEKLVGQWTGMDSIAVTVVDSTGNSVVQELVAPIELEYLADSTFTAVITVNDSTTITVGGVATVADPAVTFTGSMTCVQSMDLSGDMKIIAEPEALVVNFTAVNPEATVTHNGKANLTRKVAAAVPAK
ncbi:MAG: hypothetical protein ABFC28_05900 [Rikenellaceae bacterium]